MVMNFVGEAILVNNRKQQSFEYLTILNQYYTLAQVINQFKLIGTPYYGDDNDNNEDYKDNDNNDNNEDNEDNDDDDDNVNNEDYKDPSSSDPRPRDDQDEQPSPRET